VNKILKAILGVGHVIVDTAVPGGSAVTEAAEAIIKAHGTPGKADDAEAIFQTGVASLTLMENFVQFADEPDFQTGLYQAKAGFTLMAKAIQAHRK
jgi:hypothetical protein